MTPSPRLLGPLALSLAVTLVACGPPTDPRHGGEAAARRALSPGPLLPPDALPHDVLWRQRVTISFQDQSHRFDAVLQKQGPRLSLIGLGPMGSPAFVIVHAPEGVQLDNRTDRRLPFEPDYILADVQRVYYPWLAPTDATTDREGDVEGLHVVEAYGEGRLQRRTFTRDDAPARGDVVVRYVEWRDGELAPRRVELSNGWFGYQITIETFEQQAL